MAREWKDLILQSNKANSISHGKQLVSFEITNIIGNSVLTHANEPRVSSRTFHCVQNCVSQIDYRYDVFIST